MAFAILLRKLRIRRGANTYKLTARNNDLLIIYLRDDAVPDLTGGAAPKDRHEIRNLHKLAPNPMRRSWPETWFSDAIQVGDAFPGFLGDNRGRFLHVRPDCHSYDQWPNLHPAQKSQSLNGVCRTVSWHHAGRRQALARQLYGLRLGILRQRRLSTTNRSKIRSGKMCYRCLRNKP